MRTVYKVVMLMLAGLLVLMTGMPFAFAKKVDVQRSYPLFNELRMKPAKWDFASEVSFIDSSTALKKPIQVKLGRYLSPSGKVYYFGVVELTGHHWLYVANRRQFLSIEKWKRYIHNISDYELIGASLGVYSGPITVTLATSSGATHGKTRRASGSTSAPPSK